MSHGIPFATRANPRQRFSKTARLLTKADYQDVFATECRVAHPLLTIFVRPNGQPTARLGLAISRKCARRAIDRNRIKRIIREAFRCAHYSLPALDIVVLCRSEAVTASNAIIRHTFLSQLNKVYRRTCASLSSRSSGVTDTSSVPC